MSERDPLIERLRAAGSVPPPPDAEAALARAMEAIPARARAGRLRRVAVGLIAAALLGVPTGVLVVGSVGDDAPADQPPSLVDDARDGHDQDPAAPTKPDPIAPTSAPDDHNEQDDDDTDTDDADTDDDDDTDDEDRDDNEEPDEEPDADEPDVDEDPED